ncbi:hypothetical protein BDF19DRAFT_57957 [Syncephalis fuscata]|nr:hypothetical protein BDF19DRAFT_57957 [Syncephalis fuscata]
MSALPEQEANESGRDRHKRRIQPRLPFGADTVDFSGNEYPQKRNRLNRSDSLSSESSSVTSTPGTSKTGKVTLRLKSVGNESGKSTATNGFAEHSSSGTVASTGRHSSGQRAKAATSTNSGLSVPSIKQILVCFHCLKTTAPSSLLTGVSDEMLPASRKSFITCTDCQRKYHALCAGLTVPRSATQASEYPWQCRNCKRCTVCDKDIEKEKNDEKSKISSSSSKQSSQICTGCDRAWHIACTPSNMVRKKKKGRLFY